MAGSALTIVLIVKGDGVFHSISLERQRCVGTNEDRPVHAMSAGWSESSP